MVIAHTAMVSSPSDAGVVLGRAANELDLRTTLGRVCSAVLYDRSVSSGVRRLRAEALR